MFNVITERYPKGVSVKTSTALAVTSVDLAVAQSLKGKMIQFEVLTGNIWFEFDGTATASTGYLITATSGVKNFTVGDHLSIISDGSGATYQYAIVTAGA